MFYEQNKLWTTSYQIAKITKQQHFEVRRKNKERNTRNAIEIRIICFAIQYSFRLIPYIFINVHSYIFLSSLHNIGYFSSFWRFWHVYYEHKTVWEQTKSYHFLVNCFDSFDDLVVGIFPICSNSYAVCIQVLFPSSPLKADFHSSFTKRKCKLYWVNNQRGNTANHNIIYCNRRQSHIYK